MALDLLRHAFADIIAGQSSGKVGGRSCWVKHLSHSDQIGFDARREAFYEEARREGTVTEDEKIAQLRKDGEWSDEKELALTRARQYVIELEEAKIKNAKMPSMVEGYVKQIETAKKDYETKLIEKRILIGLTCEVYADREINDHYILSNLFEDKEMHNGFFGPGQFEYLTDEEVQTIVADYNIVLEGCSDANLKRLAMQPFFQRYFGLTGDNLRDFFGKPICNLTFFQVELLRYAAHFRHIYSTHDVAQWPKEVQEDPDRLTDHANAVSKGKEEMQKQGAYDQDAINVGMKKEDAAALGVKQNPNLIGDIMKSGGNVLDYFAKRGGG